MLATLRDAIASNPKYVGYGIGCSKSADPLTTQWNQGIGITINGIPIGDPTFVQQKLTSELSKIEAKIDNTITLHQLSVLLRILFHRCFAGSGPLSVPSFTIALIGDDGKLHIPDGHLLFAQRGGK